MSILIKGMTMPKTCDDCIVPLSKCDFLQRRADDCPLIEIPTPHGRLIDASELIKSYMKGTKTDIDDFYNTIDIIDNAPTILEEEG